MLRRHNAPPEYEDVVDIEPTPYFIEPLPPVSQEQGQELALPSGSDSSAPPSGSLEPPSPFLPVETTPAPPPLYTGPLQFVFLSEDVLNSKIIQAHSGNTAFTVSSSNPAQTQIVDGDGVPVVDVLWHWDDAPELNFDYKGKTVELKVRSAIVATFTFSSDFGQSWMTRSKQQG